MSDLIQDICPFCRSRVWDDCARRPCPELAEELDGIDAEVAAAPVIVFPAPSAEGGQP